MTEETKEETIVSTPDTNNTSSDATQETGSTTPVAVTDTTKNEVNTANANVSDASTKVGKDGLPKGVKARLWELAEKNRKLEAEIEKYKATPTQTPIPNSNINTQTNDVSTNLLDDPEKWAASVEGKILSKAEQNILARLKQAEAEKKITNEANEAKEYLLSQPEMSDEETIGEMQALIATPEVQAICSVSPKKGAEYALHLWKQSKGIDSASVAKANANAAMSASIKPTGVTAGKKTWTRAEISKYLSDYKHPEFNKRKAEIDLAIAEGRIQ